MKCKTSPLMAVAAIAALTACNWSNPHGSQELPPIKRLSEPQGATLHIERLNWRMEIPTDLPQSVYEDERIRIEKDGRTLYEGLLSDLPQVSQGNYELPRR